MAKSEAKATFICEWQHKNETYRLVALGKWSKGYRDKYNVDKLTQDSMGEPCWELMYTFDASDHTSSFAVLLSAIESVYAKPLTGWTDVG